MKKILLFCAIAICFQLTVSAQKSRVGLSGGANLSNMTSNVNGQKTSGDQRTGIVFGMVIETPVNKLISFHPGIFYAQKGKDEIPDIINAPDTKISYALRYIEFNLNFVANTHGQKINLYGGAGPSFSMNLPSKKITNVSGAKSTTELTFGKTGVEDFRGIDWGANFIVGMRMANGAFISFNYNQSFFDISGNPAVNETRNNYIGVQIGILIKNK